MGKRGLGRGLSALIAENVAGDGESRVRQVPVAHISPNPYQPRTLFDPIQMEELVNSIREHGVLQPILLREVGHERFQLVAGERRFRAAQTAGMTMVPAILKECTDRDLLEMAIIENVQRVDIGPMEAARAYRRMIDEFNMTQETVSQRVGKHRSSIANILRLLELPESVQDSLERGEISEGHGKALLKLKDQADLLVRAWERTVAGQLSVRGTEKIVEDLLTPAPSEAPPQPVPTSGATTAPPSASAPSVAVSSFFTDPHEAALTEELRERVGTKVQVRREGRDRGRIEIDFYSEEDLQRIFDVLLGTNSGQAN